MVIDLAPHGLRISSRRARACPPWFLASVNGPTGCARRGSIRTADRRSSSWVSRARRGSGRSRSGLRAIQRLPHCIRYGARNSFTCCRGGMICCRLEHRTTATAISGIVLRIFPAEVGGDGRSALEDRGRAEGLGSGFRLGDVWRWRYHEGTDADGRDAVHSTKHRLRLRRISPAWAPRREKRTR